MFLWLGGWVASWVVVTLCFADSGWARCGLWLFRVGFEFGAMEVSVAFFVTVRVVSWLVGTVLGCCVSDVV